jgi:predicted dehydrogenase
MNNEHEAKMRKQLKVGLIGCGTISIRHMAGWERVPQAEVVALCDRSPERFTRLITKYGRRETFTDIDDLLKNVDCEIIDIATRPDSHEELVCKAAEAGKHILCQKPLAPTLEAARRMVRVCEDNNVRAMVCENWRWFIWFQVIKRLLSSGVIGEAKYAKLTSHNWYTIPKGDDPVWILSHPQTYLKNMKRLLVYEMVIHHIDVLRFLFGDPDSLYARMGTMSEYIAGEDFVTIILNFTKMHCIIDASWCSREPQNQQKCEYMLVEGTEGSIVLNQNGRVQVVRTDGKSEFPDYNWKSETKTEAHFRVLKHFVDRIVDRASFQTDVRDNIKTLEIAIRSYESAREDRVIPLQKGKLLPDQLSGVE